MQIRTTKKFDKQFKKQSAKIKDAFKNRISIFLTNIDHPQLRVHKLSGTYSGLWSFNVTGDVRVIFDRTNEPTILFIAIGSHSELYG